MKGSEFYSEDNLNNLFEESINAFRYADKVIYEKHFSSIEERIDELNKTSMALKIIYKKIFYISEERRDKKLIEYEESIKGRMLMIEGIVAHEIAILNFIKHGVK